MPETLDSSLPLEVATESERPAQRLAKTMLESFNRHYALIRAYGRDAKALFEAGDWKGVQNAVRERIPAYGTRAADTARLLGERIGAGALDDATWRQAKLYYIGMLINHKQPELAETFFSSVCTRLLHRSYFHNAYIFTRPAVSTEYIEGDPPTYRSYFPMQTGLRATLARLLREFDWQRPFDDLERDVDRVAQAIETFPGGLRAVEPNTQIQILGSAFYRNKAAYVFGKLISGTSVLPLAIPILHNGEGRLIVDTVLLESWRIAVLFSLSRAYFMVDMEVPSAYVQFLQSIMPHKPRSEIYTMLGLGKQGKTMFYRDLKEHLRHSEDKFIVAPGIPGMVMLVFTLPSYPYVFKVIKDQFPAAKETDRATIMAKYQLVKQVDRSGRMADSLEFSLVVLPRRRFSEDLLAALRAEVPSQIEEDNDELLIKHVYIERRMTPLNLYLDRASPEQIEHAVIEYGNAIREMAYANVFPGDMLWKNFGVTSYDRVVFYDYDEIESMTDCNFRAIPPAPYPEMEMASETWYPVARNDVFPEQFAAFLLGSPKVRSAFLRHHRDLLGVDFWKSTQDKIRAGHIESFFPYPEDLRFCNRFRDD